MSYEPPTPPAELPTDIVNTLNDYSSDQLQQVARYAEELARSALKGKWGVKSAGLDQQSGKGSYIVTAFL